MDYGRLLIRTDGNRSIGGGHIARCASIAEAAVSLGHDVLFAVSDSESAALVERKGFEARVVGGDYREFTEADAELLVGLIEESWAVLVDSYAVTPAFLDRLHEICCATGVRLGYVDDLFTFADGHLEEPRVLDVDVVVNYSFGTSVRAYESAYAGSGVDFLLGPSFAPVGNRFINRCARANFPPQNILVTSGSTNPNCALERMVEGVHVALPDVDIDLVVGAGANYSGMRGACVHEHHGMSDLSNLMANCDIAVSAAGTTLYELACMGLPTIAIPVVENQMANARGWVDLGFGCAMGFLDSDESGLGQIVYTLAANRSRYEHEVSSLRCTVDGQGARRVVESLWVAF